MTKKQLCSTRSWRLKRLLPFFLLLLLASAPLFSGGSQEAGSSQEAALKGPESSMAVLEETEESVIFQEASGNVTVVPKNPERPIVCLNSILDLWYMAGGTSLARVKGSISVPEEAAELPILGTISTLNTELIMELEPDFIIFSDTDSQNRNREFFEREGVPCLTIDYDTYDDFRVLLDLFTRVNGSRDIYEEEIIPTERQVEALIEQVPRMDPPVRVGILFATTRYVKAETINTVTGDYCRKLGAENIYNHEAIEGATRVDLSLEYIVEQDPDIIFVTTMGDVEKCKERMEKDIISSDVWGELSAVKNGRFHYLDKSFSLYKPNRDYPGAFQRVAELLYPEADFSLERE